MFNTPDSKVHGANMGPTWVLSSPGGPHVGPMNLAIRDYLPRLHLRVASMQAARHYQHARTMCEVYCVFVHSENEYLSICPFKLLLGIKKTLNRSGPARRQALSEPMMFNLVTHICVTRPQ